MKTTNATVVLCQSMLSYYYILYSLLIFRGYLLVTHILSCYNALDKIVHFWEKKLKEHTYHLPSHTHH